MSLLQVPLTQVKTVQQMLMTQQARDQLAMVAGKHVTPERMMRLMAGAIRNNPTLGECHPITLLGAMMQCATLGLEPNTYAGHAFLIPFRNNKKNIVEVQLVIGYKGFIELAYRAGIIIDADIHRADDLEWVYRKGYNPTLEHVPGPGRGEPLHAYAVATFPGPNKPMIARVLPWSEIIATRDASSGYRSAIQYKKDHPWISREPAMAKKTAIRRLASMLPMGGGDASAALSDALDVDDRRMDFAGFALNPEAGSAMIDGEAIAQDDPAGGRDEAADRQPEPEPQKARARSQRQAQDKAAPGPKAEDEAELSRAREAEAARAERAARERAIEAEREEGQRAQQAKAPARPEQDPLYVEVKTLLEEHGIDPGAIRAGMAEKFDDARRSKPEVWAAIDNLLSGGDTPRTDPGEDDDFVGVDD